MAFQDTVFPSRTTSSTLAADRHSPEAAQLGGTAEALAATLLSGRSAAMAARAAGIVVADSYHVLAVDIAVSAAVGEHHGPGSDRPGTDIAGLIDPGALAHRTAHGTTVLLPAGTGRVVDTLTDLMAPAVGAPVSAVVAEAAPADIPQAAEQVWEVMDVVRRLHLPAGVYRFDDLALEYQLTRPGPGRDQLGSLLDPLDGHPELTRTLRTHIANNLNRQRTARTLHIHPNTVDYRLKRIGELTGLDANEAPGLWYLRSALVVRGYAEAE
ncbi:PucR family transcriptional regulator [Nocardia sp. CA-290969]|uniref:PucR family transcriptional regulator n=1 Tax=Nocardia sp. CA-290969 TaxID=3239986 RepID=UPI003D8D1828